MQKMHAFCKQANLEHFSTNKIKTFSKQTFLLKDKLKGRLAFGHEQFKKGKIFKNEKVQSYKDKLLK